MSESEQGDDGPQDEPAPLLSVTWRRERVLQGDFCLLRARESEDPAKSMYWIALAQAHYAAANVRVTEPKDPHATTYRLKKSLEEG
jgi:hypothetical protein